MTKVIFDISMSLDGYINAQNPRPEAGLGDGGERLHEWAFNSEDAYNKELVGRMIPSLGAMIAGRNTYDLSMPHWGANGPTGPARVPIVVLTHEVPREVPKDHVYTFVNSVGGRGESQAACGRKRNRRDGWRGYRPAVPASRLAGRDLDPPCPGSVWRRYPFVERVR